MDLSFALVFKCRMFFKSRRHLNRLASYNEGSLLCFAARCCISDRISLLTSVYYMSQINNTADFKAITCCSVIDCTYILAHAFPAFCLRYFPFFYCFIFKHWNQFGLRENLVYCKLQRSSCRETFVPQSFMDLM